MGRKTKIRTPVEPKIKARASIELIQSKKLLKVGWLMHAFSTRIGGVSRSYGGSALNLGFTKDDARVDVERNRELFLKELGVTRNGEGSKRKAGNGKTATGKPSDGKASIKTTWPLVTLRQIHSDLVHFVDYLPERTMVGDGLITDTPGVLIAVQAADCLPVIVVDKKRHAIGVFHAGWRGTVKRIVEKGIGEMRRHFGSEPGDMMAAIGPGIQSCCYEVGEEVRTKFESQFAYAADLFRVVKESDPVREKYPLLFLTARAPGHSELPVKLFLDLVEANRRQLLDAGVPEKSIDTSAPCTACHPEMLFSFRADKGVTGRMLGVAGIRPE